MNIAQQLSAAGTDPNSRASQTAQHEAVIKTKLPVKQPDSQITVTLANGTNADQYFSVMNDAAQLSYAAFGGIVFDTTGDFVVSVQHPAGIGGFRDFFKENHLLAPAFAYNVGVVTAINQFSAPIFAVTLDPSLTIQQNTSILNAVTKAQTGNTLTNFAIVVNQPIALTRCSDLVIKVLAGVTVVLTFQTYLKTTTR